MSPFSLPPRKTRPAIFARGFALPALLLLLGTFLLPSHSPAQPKRENPAAAPLLVEPRYQAGPETYALLDLSMPDFRPKSSLPVRFQITIEDGRVSRFMLLANPVNRFLEPRFVVTDASVKGSVKIISYGHKGKPAQILPIALDLKIDGAAVTGTYDIQQADPPIAPEVANGAITGEYLTEQALLQRNALAEGVEWPCWLGPEQSFAATKTDALLIDDLRQARLVWRSTPIGSAELHRTGLTLYRDPPAGGYSPVLHRGMIFQLSYAVTGDRVYARFDKDREVTASAAAQALKTLDEARRNWLIEADDVITAIHASTGKTLWQTTIPNVGRNWPAHKTALTNWSPVAHDGKLYVMGSTALLYCLDANSGKLLWHTPVPKMHATVLDYRARGEEGLGGRETCNALNIAAGVILAPGSNRGAPLQGIDAQTGRPLWSYPHGPAHRTTPLRITLDNREYALIVGTDRFALLDPATGKPLWEQTGITGDTQPGFDGQRLVVNAITKAEREALIAANPGDSRYTQSYGRTTCYQINLDGPKQIWQLDHTYGAPTHKAYVSADGWLFLRGGTPERGFTVVEMATGKIVYEEPDHKNTTECHAFWMNGRYFAEPDSQHDATEWMFYQATRDNDAKQPQIAPLPPSDQPSAGSARPAAWRPPHGHTTTYGAPLSHVAADGRIYIRGQDGVYCYDVRRRKD